MTIDYINDSELLKALAHPVRLRMVEGLLNHECNVSKIVKVLNLPQSTISQHLGILKNRGVVTIRKEGVKTCYRVTNARVAQLVKILGK
ncbi:MAG: metalloregulator ArsR/SmtB family transcription factor [Candidatus Omnitrophica bacterium]|nr:metalloregulator ArsR/SmtB family transcription factor [Candidatus Omnitrophota bacterium]